MYRLSLCCIAALTLSACVPNAPSSPKPDKTQGAAAITATSSGEDDSLNLIRSEGPRLTAMMRETCDDIRGPHIFFSRHPSSVSSARKDMALAKTREKNLPKTKACYTQALPKLIERRRAGIDRFNATALRVQNKIDSKEGYVFPWSSAPKNRLKSYDVISSEIDDIEAEYATAKASIDRSITRAARELKRSKSKRNAIISAGIQGAMNNGAFDASGMLNQSRKNAGLPPLMTQTELAEFQRARQQLDAENAVRARKLANRNSGGAKIVLSVDLNCKDKNVPGNSRTLGNSVEMSQEDFKAQCAEQQARWDQQFADREAARRAQEAEWAAAAERNVSTPRPRRTQCQNPPCTAMAQ